jgi:hypothetical protein
MLAEIPNAPGAVSLRLERAWNSSDTEALATFDDDARAISQWGQVWQGKDQLAYFLQAFFYQGEGPAGRPLETVAQCEESDQIIWTFRYPTGPSAAAIFTVTNERIAKVYWMFLASESDATVPSTAVPVPRLKHVRSLCSLRLC